MSQEPFIVGTQVLCFYKRGEDWYILHPCDDGTYAGKSMLEPLCQNQIVIPVWNVTVGTAALRSDGRIDWAPRGHGLVIGNIMCDGWLLLNPARGIFWGAEDNVVCATPPASATAVGVGASKIHQCLPVVLVSGNQSQWQLEWPEAV